MGEGLGDGDTVGDGFGVGNGVGVGEGLGDGVGVVWWIRKETHSPRFLNLVSNAVGICCLMSLQADA